MKLLMKSKFVPLLRSNSRYNKFLAKTASDVNKPNGMFVITPEIAQDFIDNLEIRKFFGIGKVTTEKLNKMGVWYGRDLKKIDRLQMVTLFGKAGNYYYEICRGEDNRVVQPSRKRKSVGAEQTFSADLYDEKEILTELLKIADDVWKRLEKTAHKPKTLTLKFKYTDFEQHTRSITIPGVFYDKNIFLQQSKKLVKSEGGFIKGIRLLGLTFSNFFEENKSVPQQLTLNF